MEIPRHRQLAFLDKRKHEEREKEEEAGRPGQKERERTGTEETPRRAVRWSFFLSLSVGVCSFSLSAPPSRRIVRRKKNTRSFTNNQAFSGGQDSTDGVGGRVGLRSSCLLFAFVWRARESDNRPARLGLSYELTKKGRMKCLPDRSDKGGPAWICVHAFSQSTDTLTAGWRDREKDNFLSSL